MDLVRLRVWLRNEYGIFEKVSYGGCVLKKASAMIADREALRKGIEHLTVFFPTVVSSFDFQVENSGGTVQYKLDAQSLRLFGLHSDVNDAHRAGTDKISKTNKQQTCRHGWRKLRRHQLWYLCPRIRSAQPTDWTQFFLFQRSLRVVQAHSAWRSGFSRGSPPIETRRRFVLKFHVRKTKTPFFACSGILP